jgi:membrane-bound ClpP family serine protease
MRIAGPFRRLVAWLALGSAACMSAPAGAQVASAPAWRQASRVAVVTVHGEIDAVRCASAQRRIEAAARDGANAVVLELDTPGGDLYATLGFCIWLKERAPVPVWAWVRPRAFSAGAIIALACRGIVTSPAAAMGDAAPIAALPGLGLQPLPVAERAKLEAPVLSEVVDSARRNGYDETVVRAFVSAPDEVWALESVEDGRRIFVGREEFREAFGEEPPMTRAAGAAPREALGGERPLAVLVDRAMRRAPAEDGPTNDAERDALVAEQQVRPPVRARLAPADAAAWRVSGQVDGAQELLVVQGPEAAAFGLSLATVDDDRALSAFFGATALDRRDENLGDAVVRLLTSWPVRLLLIAVLLGGFILEMMAPGLSWPGAAATVALVLLLGAPALAGVTSWWPLLVVIAGAALVLAEVFLVPGVGVVGVMGVACILVGIVGSFIGAPLDTPEGRSDLAGGIGVVAGGLILAGGAAWLLLRVVPRAGIVRAAVLEAQAGMEGATSPAPRTVRPAVGDAGRALTPLRPVGRAEFGSTTVEVQARGSFVDAGTHVRVVRSDAYGVEVEPCE